MSRRGAIPLAALLGLAALGLGASALVEAARSTAQDSASGRSARQDGRLQLRACRDGATGEEYVCGTYEVFENRAAGTGRTILLNLLILPATGEERRADPVFVLAGGPGQAATTTYRGYARSWMREGRDIVFIDQRGTGKSNPLDCGMAGQGGDLQGYLEPIFTEEVFRPCLEALQRKADLTQYSTPIAMDDVDEVRAALGYDRINLVGGSYGSRAALVYMRRHPETVRCAILMTIAPISFKNPLYHAAAAQEGLERLFEECAGDPRCRERIPDLEKEFTAVLARLQAEPAPVTLETAGGGEATVFLSRAAFGEALRVMMYSGSNNRKVPWLIHRAFLGDYAPFVRQGIQTNRGLRDMLSFGMLLCVTCAEDVARITEEEIERETAGTFLGPGRVRRQKAVCAFWPRSDISEDFGEPVAVDVPVLLFSGTHDPVTPPRFGEAAARHLPNSVHVVVPGAHGFSDPCVESVRQAFLARPSAGDLDTSCVASIRQAPLQLAD